jgi:hypothetical protein
MGSVDRENSEKMHPLGDGVLRIAAPATGPPLLTRAVLCSCADVYECILRELDPQSAIALSQTCSAAYKLYHAVLDTSPSLLATVASNADRALTKSAIMGWFALTSSEASGIHHAVYLRRAGGVYFLYSGDAFRQAAATVGRQWPGRVALRRARSTPSIRKYPYSRIAYQRHGGGANSKRPKLHY